MPPEVPLEHAHETIEHHAHSSHERWIMGVALTAAILAALAAVTALLGEHSAQEAIVLRVDASDNWNEFQANSIKEKVLRLKRDLKGLSPEDEKDLEKYEKNKERLKEQATEHAEESVKCLKRHTPLSASLTMFQVAIAIGAISVLTKRRPFWYLAMVFGAIGVGFLAWGVWMWLH